jgi:hypothetical protein
LETITPGAREGYFYIVAGNLKKKINVRQLDEEEFSLELEPWEVTFYRTATGPKTVTLIPALTGAPVYTLGATGNVEWRDDNDPVVDQASILVDNLLSLWPKDNAGSTTLGSSVLVTLHGADGRTVTRVVDVRQLARDPVFNAVTKNPYPAVAGNYTFTVASEVPWALAASGSPAAMLTLPDGSMHGANPSAPYTYTFHLDAYAAGTYSTATRSEVITVTSNDPGLPAGTTITIVQDASPYIVITNPASKEHDFGETTTPRNVTFKTNAGWSFSGDANFDNVIDEVSYKSSSIMAGAVQTGSTSPDTEVTETLAFTPLAPGGTALAGKKSTVVTFTTDNPADAALNTSDAMIFHRFVPVRWEFVRAEEQGAVVEDGDEILPGPTTVTLFANANLRWHGQATDNTAGGTAGTVKYSTPVAYTEDDPNPVPVPARPVGEAASWIAPGTATVRAGYEALPGIPGLFPAREISFERPAYRITVTCAKLTYNSVELTVWTDAPGFSLDLRAGATNGSSVGSLEKTGNGGTYKVTLTPSNKTGTAKKIYVMNKHSNEEITNFLQPSVRYVIRAAPAKSGATTATLCPDGYTVYNPSTEGSPLGITFTSTISGLINNTVWIYPIYEANGSTYKAMSIWIRGGKIDNYNGTGGLTEWAHVLCAY